MTSSRCRGSCCPPSGEAQQKRCQPTTADYKTPPSPEPYAGCETTCSKEKAASAVSEIGLTNEGRSTGEDKDGKSKDCGGGSCCPKEIGLTNECRSTGKDKGGKSKDCGGGNCCSEEISLANEGRSTGKDGKSKDSGGGNCCSGEIGLTNGGQSTGKDKDGKSKDSGGSNCCSEEKGICFCDGKCFRKYAAYIHKHSHLNEMGHEIEYCAEKADMSVVPNSVEKFCNDQHDEHNYHHEKHSKPETCASCLHRAELDGTTITSTQDMSVIKCYCVAMKAFASSFRHTISGTIQSSVPAIDWGCCTRQPTTKSECCSGAVSLDGKDGMEDYIVNIGQDGALTPCFLSLTITGMTCTGCADKVVHVLKSMNGVLPDSVKVSFLNNRAEMTFFPDIRGEDEIVGVLRKKTGFRVAIMSSGSLEDVGLVKVRIGVCGEAFDIIEKLEVVRSIKFLKRENQRSVLEIGYDPAIIGVRDLLSNINNRNGGFDASIIDTPDEEAVASEAERKHLRHLGTITLAAGILTVPVVVLAWAPLPNVDIALKYTIQMPLATTIMGMAYQIYLNALRTMTYGGAGGSRVDMDVLVLVATFAAWGFSVAIFIIDTNNHTLGGTGKEPFFETCSLLVTLILLGRWVTGGVRMWAMNRAVALGDENRKEGSKTISLVEGSSVRKIDERLLQYADILLAEKGDTITTDGVVMDGEAEVDESLLTGEAKPAVIQAGRLVMAGSNIVNGQLKYRVTRLMHENTVSVIKRMVRSASGKKPKVQEMADRFAATLTPIVLTVSLAVFIIWLLVSRLIRGSHWSDSAVNAISYAVATLAVSCPCAIGLAVPMVMVFASRVAMRKCGFLFVNVIAVEKGWKAHNVVFDKTGTLTTGKLEVVFKKTLCGADWGNEVEGRVRALVKTLCEGEKHPVSRALAASVGSSEGHPDIVVDTVVGKGLEAVIDGQLVRGGQPSWCSPTGEEHPIVREVIQQGLTVFALSIDQELKAVFGLEDAIRPEAVSVIAELHRRCIETHIFSGDHKHAVEKVSAALGIPAENCRSSCSPDQKSSEIKALQSQSQPRKSNKRKGSPERAIVLFLGDGTNDAVALAQADVGLSMSDSTSVAISAADVAILSTSLTSIIDFLDLSKRVKTCIWVSFAYAVLWNFFAILAAGGGFVVVRISPEWAGLGELGSVLPVVVIAAFVGVRWKAKTYNSGL